MLDAGNGPIAVNQGPGQKQLLLVSAASCSVVVGDCILLAGKWQDEDLHQSCSS